MPGAEDAGFAVLLKEWVIVLCPGCRVEEVRSGLRSYDAEFVVVGPAGGGGIYEEDVVPVLQDLRTFVYVDMRRFWPVEQIAHVFPWIFWIGKQNSFGVDRPWIFQVSEIDALFTVGVSFPS